MRLIDKTEIVSKSVPIVQKPEKAIPRRDPISRTFVKRNEEKVSVVQNRPTVVRQNLNADNKPNIIRQFPNVECMNCGETGHFWRGCKKKPIDMDRVNRKWDEVKKQRTGEYWRAKENAAPIHEFTPIEDMTEEEFQQYLQDSCGMTDPETEEEGSEEGAEPPPTGKNNMMVIAGSDPKNRDLIRHILREVESPRIDIQVNDVIVTGLVDTGASFTVVSEEIALKLNAQKIPWYLPELKAVNNQICTPKWMLKDLKFTQLGKTIILSAGILVNMSNKLILGMDYINKMGLFIDVPRRTIGLSDAHLAQITHLRETAKELREKLRSSNNSKSTVKHSADLQNIKSDQNSSDDENLYKPEKYYPIGVGDANINTCMIQNQHPFGDMAEQLPIQPKPKKIVPEVVKETFFEPGQKQLVLFRIKDGPIKGEFITKTLRSALKNGWRVEKGILSAQLNRFKVWVHNKTPNPQCLGMWRQCLLVKVDRSRND